MVRPEVWELAVQPSGGRIRFSSDTTALGIHVSYDEITPGHNMCTIGKAGFALYVDGEFWKAAWPEGAGESEFLFFEGVERRAKEITIYLPLYQGVRVLGIGVDEGAGVSPPRQFAVERPVAFYGSSITQGGCASQPGMSYQAILGRMLNIDFVNLGFSGEGRGEPEMARAFAEIDGSSFVVDFAQNCRTVEEMRENYGPFLTAIRALHTDAAIVCVTPIFATSELYDGGQRKRLSAMREVVRDAVAARWSGGDRNVRIVEGTTLISTSEGDSFVDGVHPNDLGFQRMAERLAPVVADALGIR